MRTSAIKLISYLSLRNIKHTLLALLLLLPAVSYAEYNHELGVMAGTSFYLGDANLKTPFHRPQLSIGGLYRYNIDTRWALKLRVAYVKIAGNSADFGYVFPNKKQASFERDLIDMGVHVEINFLDIGGYRYYTGRYKASPYLLLGVGFASYNDLNMGKNSFEWSIPVGIGGKWKINKRFTLGLEWSLHKTFTDRLDVTKSDNAILDDPYHTGKTGFLDTDWYSTALLYLSVNLVETNRFCR